MITRIPAPRINTNDDKMEVVSWYQPSGTFVEEGQEIGDLETSKAMVTLTAEHAGWFHPLVNARSVVAVGEPLYLLTDGSEELITASQDTLATDIIKPIPGTPSWSDSGSFAASRFSNAALKWIEAHGLDPNDLHGMGLVTARSLGKQAKPSSPASMDTEAFRYASLSVGPHTPRSEKVSLAKQSEIQTLSVGEQGNINSKLSVYFDSELIRARLLQEQSFDGNIQPLILYEIARLLKKWPQFTAYYQDGVVHYYDRVDLGLALDLGKGLKVVTLPEADKLLPVHFYEKTIEIGMRYLENRIRPDELVDSTLTITDLSSFNVLHFHPLINGHQAAIIGIGGDGSLPGHPMSINMTFDHRISNGRDVATFLGELRNRLMSYALLEENHIPFSATDFEYIEGFPQLGVVATNSEKDTITSEICCDRCAIDLQTYIREFSRDAFMLAYFREDGSLGAVCHRCSGGW